ncbi:MAG: hypothetical protein QOJ89_848 [bacterium]
MSKSVAVPAAQSAERSAPAGTPTAAPGDRFRPDVEGLRALAVGLVVLYHAGVPGIRAGYIGVDVFFVVSGFVITRLLVRERIATGRISLLGFYARRARRILPAATVVTIATVVATYKILGPFAGPQVASDGKWAALFSANLHFADLATSYLGSQQPPSPLQHMWSLGVEEQFYLAWPLLLMIVALRAPDGRAVLRRSGCLLVLIVAASYGWSIIATSQNATSAFYSPLTRGCELGLGALAAVMSPALRRLPDRLSAPLALVGLAGIVFSALYFTKQSRWPGALVAVTAVATALVIVAGSIKPASIVERMLGVRPVRWLGSRSYSVYLWHWPVLILAEERAGKPVLPLAQAAALVVAALVLAELSYRIVEHPIRSSRWLRSRPRVAVAGGLSLSLLTFVLMVTLLES